MKKAATIFLFCLYLFCTTEAKQLFKIPMLVQHFNEHKAHNKNTTLLGFLKMHYLAPVIFDKDYADDMKLPFKEHDADLCLSFMPTIPTPKFEMDIVITPVVKQNIPLTNDAQYSFLSTHDIFQPPKAA